MTLEELKKKIADIEKIYEKRYYSAMQDWYAYKEQCASGGKVVVIPEPSKSEFKRLSLLSVERARKDYLMESFPVRVGDMVEVVQHSRTYRGDIKTFRYYLRVQHISVAGVNDPVLKFGGKWFRVDGQPYIKQPVHKLISQKEIKAYGPNIKNLKPIKPNEETKDKS